MAILQVMHAVRSSYRTALFFSQTLSSYLTFVYLENFVVCSDRRAVLDCAVLECSKLAACLERTGSRLPASKLCYKPEMR